MRFKVQGGFGSLGFRAQGGSGAFAKLGHYALDLSYILLAPTALPSALLTIPGAPKVF